MEPDNRPIRKRYCPGSHSDPTYYCKDDCDHHGEHDEIPGCGNPCENNDMKYCEFVSDLEELVDDMARVQQHERDGQFVDH